MTDQARDKFAVEAVREDFIPKDAFFSREFWELEKDRLWPFVWQIACREEEIPNVGDYVTYDILDDSIIVLRSAPGEIKAFHNVCPHRGNRLTEGCGRAKQFICSFHGWRFGVNGENLQVVDRQDWGDLLTDEDVRLKPVQVGTWGGFVFINMDAGCQPLAEFLAPMNELCALHEFDKLRYAWYRTIEIDANWKTICEAFNEFYHVQTTHRQMLSFTDDYSASKPMGRHGWISYASEFGFPVGRSPRLPAKDEPDFRKLMLDLAHMLKYDLDAMQTERSYQAAQRLREEAGPDTPPGEVLQKVFEWTVEAAIKDGSGWPEGMTPEYMAASGYDWHVFPNTVFLHGSVEAVLWYRMRPHPDHPEKSVFDIWSLQRFAPGTEPELKREYYKDWRECDWPLIYTQDFENIPRVQKGMHSRAFKGSRTSPVQERAIPNFHRALRRFLKDPHADDGKI